MRIFGILGAEHFCGSFGSLAVSSSDSLKEFERNRLRPTARNIEEGTPLYNEFRDCSLRNVELNLFFAASHYRRSLDLMLTSSSPWALVTLYYGSWFASSALLGMFGCAIFDKHVIDVDRDGPGNQRLQYRKIGSQGGQWSTTYSGSHRRFWDFFYQNVGNLTPMVSPESAAVLTPIASNVLWQIEQRNAINYDPYLGACLARDFAASFSSLSFPSSLPGDLGTQFRILSGLLELCFKFRRDFGLQTDALDIIATPNPLPVTVKEMVFHSTPPGLVNKINKASITKP